MELLSQLDGFEALGKVKLVAATNRPDVLDPALMRPGRLDRKIEIPLPNEQVRVCGGGGGGSRGVWVGGGMREEVVVQWALGQGAGGGQGPGTCMRSSESLLDSSCELSANSHHPHPTSTPPPSLTTHRPPRRRPRPRRAWRS